MTAPFSVVGKCKMGKGWLYYIEIGNYRGAAALLPPAFGWSPSLKREVSTRLNRNESLSVLIRIFEGSLLRELAAEGRLRE